MKLERLALTFRLAGKRLRSSVTRWIDEAQGKLIDRSLVERTWLEQGRLIRDRMLSVPTRLASLLASISDAHRVHELLDCEIQKALNEVADEIGRG